MIYSNAFDGCSSIMNVYYTGELEDWVKIILNQLSNPLSYGANLHIKNQLITELIIPDTINKVNPYAFYGANFSKVIIHKNVTTIGENAFGYIEEGIYCEVESKPDGWHDNWNNGSNVEWGYVEESSTVNES